MEFWASSETFRGAGRTSEIVRKAVEPHLNAAYAACSLADFNCKLRYIPIIMPAFLRARYPARSKLRRKERIWDCAPQLNDDVFADGAFEQQLREYLDGLAGSGAQLAKIGATPLQLKDFERVVTSAYEQILIERLDQTRH